MDRRTPPARGGFGRSLLRAFSGMAETFRSERNFRIHVAAMCVAIALGLYLGLSALEWGLLAFATGGVLTAELFNTAVERLGDKAAEGRHHPLVKKAKDACAAAVLISALVAFIVGFVILLLPLAQRILD